MAPVGWIDPPNWSQVLPKTRQNGSSWVDRSTQLEPMSYFPEFCGSSWVDRSTQLEPHAPQQKFRLHKQYRFFRAHSLGSMWRATGQTESRQVRSAVSADWLQLGGSIHPTGANFFQKHDETAPVGWIGPPNWSQFHVFRNFVAPVGWIDPPNWSHSTCSRSFGSRAE